MPYGENGQTSLCHPWSAGAAPWLSANVLGVRPLQPGFAAVAVAPHLTPQMAAAGGLRGAVPTPHGAVELTVEVAAAGNASSFSSSSSVSVTVPLGCAGGAELRLSEVLLARLGWLELGLSAGPGSVRVSVNGGPAVALLAAAPGVKGPRFEGELETAGARRAAAAALPPSRHRSRRSRSELVHLRDRTLRRRSPRAVVDGGGAAATPAADERGA